MRNIPYPPAFTGIYFCKKPYERCGYETENDQAFEKAICRIHASAGAAKPSGDHERTNESKSRARRRGADRGIFQA